MAKKNTTPAEQETPTEVETTQEETINSNVAEQTASTEQETTTEVEATQEETTNSDVAEQTASTEQETTTEVETTQEETNYDDIDAVDKAHNLEILDLMDRFDTDVVYENHNGERFLSHNLAMLSTNQDRKLITTYNRKDIKSCAE